MVKAKEIVKPKELPIIDERVVTSDEGDTRHSSGPEHTIRLDRDSYIILFEGRRGGGKTTAMTFMVMRAVALYNMRVIANYPIEFMLRRHRPDGKTYLQHVKAEPLDFYKLICFDEDYKNVLICIDEAPDIISHMAALTWRNRLVAAFTRQLRKNYSSLFLAAQDFELIDKSMRWQVDVIIKCKDACRTLGDNSSLDPGEMLWLNWYDNSGQWTGETTEDIIRRNQHSRVRQYVDPCMCHMELFPRIMWGDDEHMPVFDSWYQIDILDSLRKVDLKMSSIKVGDKTDAGDGDRYPVSAKALKAALESIETVLKEYPDIPNIYQKYFYQSLGGLTERDKNNLGRKLSDFNVERGGEGAKRWYGFASFDIEGFRAYVQSQFGREVTDGDTGEG